MTKVALITGAARRVGAEMARVLHAAGMNIILHYHQSVAAATELCAELNTARPASAVLLSANLADIQQITPLVTQAVQTWGRLDYLVNNAARFYPTRIGTVTTTAWDDLINSNLKAPFFLCQAAKEALHQQQGCIINIADVHAQRPMRDYAVYCISKAGLVMLTQALAKELGPQVRVNAIAPGVVMLPEGENTLDAADKEKIIQRIALKRAGTPTDIAKAVLFLLQDANYITGEILTVDGGRALFI